MMVVRPSEAGQTQPTKSDVRSAVIPSRPTMGSLGVVNMDGKHMQNLLHCQCNNLQSILLRY
jgi:hypothetical protein